MYIYINHTLYIPYMHIHMLTHSYLKIIINPLFVVIERNVVIRAFCIISRSKLCVQVVLCVQKK